MPDNDEVLQALHDFRASMSQAFEDTDARLDGLAQEIRAVRDESRANHQGVVAAMRSHTLAMTNELAALNSRWDRRYRQVEDRLGALERGA